MHKTLKYSALIIALWALAANIQPCLGQSNKVSDYYREVIVRAPGTNNAEVNQIKTALSDNQYIKIDFTCQETGELVFRVQSDYPRRIPAIRQQIIEISSQAVPSRSFSILKQKTSQQVRAACS